MRSRTGCLTCRQRKLKCDERRPVCSQCAKASRHCEPSSGIAFRHQHNASMNGAYHSDAGGTNSGSVSNGGGAVDSLAGFYSYKNTFDASAVWVEIPRSLTFHHTSDPYAEDWGAVVISDGRHAGSGGASDGHGGAGAGFGGDANGSGSQNAREEEQAALIMGLDQIMGEAQAGQGEGSAETAGMSGMGEEGGFNVRGLEALSAAALYTPPQQQQQQQQHAPPAGTSKPQSSRPGVQAASKSTTGKPARAARTNKSGKKSKAAAADAPIDPTLTSLTYPTMHTALDSSQPTAQQGGDLPEAQHQAGVRSSPGISAPSTADEAAETVDTAEHKVATLLRQFTEPSQSWQSQS